MGCLICCAIYNSELLNVGLNQHKENGRNVLPAGQQRSPLYEKAICRVSSHFIGKFHYFALDIVYARELLNANFGYSRENPRKTWSKRVTNLSVSIALGPLTKPQFSVAIFFVQTNHKIPFNFLNEKMF